MTATFSEQVTGFDNLLSDVNVTNGAITAITGGPVVYALTITPSGAGSVSIIVPNAAAQDLAGNANIASNKLVVDSQIVEVTQKQIAGFMLGRANNLVSNQPDLVRYLLDSDCGDLNTNVTERAGTLDGCYSRGHAWVELTSSWNSGSTYALASVGIHEFLNENLLAGAILQFDFANDVANNASGSGWMVGPYFAARMFEQSLFFEGRLLFGESSNEISPIGTYTDRFKTQRWLAQFKVQGEIVQERVIWSPSLSFARTTDKQRAYSDSLGNTIPEQTVGLTQLEGGMDFRMPISVANGKMDLLGGVSAIYSSTQGGFAAFEETRGRTHLGIEYDSGNGAMIAASASYDGLGSSYKSYGVSLRVDFRF